MAIPWTACQIIAGYNPGTELVNFQSAHVDVNCKAEFHQVVCAYGDYKGGDVVVCPLYKNGKLEHENVEYDTKLEVPVLGPVGEYKRGAMIEGRTLKVRHTFQLFSPLALHKPLACSGLRFSLVFSCQI